MEEGREYKTKAGDTIKCQSVMSTGNYLCSWVEVVSQGRTRLVGQQEIWNNDGEWIGYKGDRVITECIHDIAKK